MAKVEINGYTYETTGSNNVVVTGPGMPSVGGFLGPLSNLSPEMFTSLASSPNLTPEAVEAMRLMANSGDWTQVKAGLTAPEKTTADPGVQQQEQNDPGQQENETEQQNLEYQSEGGADDDAGSTENVAANQSTQAGTTNSGNGGLLSENQSSNGSQSANSKPGKRIKNPLGYFASYTYNISLYMISPDAYDAFIASGRKNVNALRDATGGPNAANANNGGGAYLIAQSGGINNSSEIRAEGFDLDYYIDNLKITTATSGKETKTASNVTDISFKIIEPYGFSFISNLKRAQDALQKKSKTKNYDKLLNPSRQFFILGLRFYGYDANGNLITKDQSFDGSVIDESNSTKGIFERFYDIIIKKMNFKIDSKAVTYNVEAASIAPNTAFNIQRGRVDTITKITANKVEEAISEKYPNSLLGKINAEQQKLVDAGKISVPNIYTVRWLGPETNPDERFKELRLATIVSKADTDKTKMPAGQEKNSNNATDATSAKSSPNTTQREITFNSDTAIMAAIEQIIKQSSYLSDALMVIQKSNDQPDTDKKTEEVIENKQPNSLKWYNLSAEVGNAIWDEKVGDFAYTITYIIQPYETPVITAAYVNSAGQKYYGPHKRYDYWYTGKNSEIIQYEQNMENTYFQVALDPGDGGKAALGAGANIPLAYKPKANASQLGKLGPGNQAQNAVVTSLFDPGAYASAKVKILGDPDFLVQESPGSINQVYNQFYGTDGFTVNPNGGQVFIEINFKEPEDYDISNGLLSINDSILFWKYPKKVQDEINKRGGGVSYMVKKIVSNFDNGKFTQDIDAIINTFPEDSVDASISSSDDARETALFRRQAAANTAGGSPNSSDSTTTNTGLVEDPPIGTSSGQVGQTPTTSDQTSSQPTTQTDTGPVANDDGGYA